MIELLAPSGNDVVIEQTVAVSTDVGFALSRIGDAPTMTLVDPNGLAITPSSLPGNVTYDESVLMDDGNILTQTLYIVSDAQPGQWEVVLHDVPEDGGAYLFLSFGANPPPVLENTSATSTGPDTAQAEWQLTSDKVTTTLDIHLNPGAITTTLVISNSEGYTETVVEEAFSGAAIAKDVPTSLDGSLSQLTLDLSDLPAGEYWVWFNAEDGRNPPTRVYASSSITVSHPWQDAWIASVEITPTFRSMDVSWQAHPNPDVDVYQIQVGSQPGLVDITYDAGTSLAWPLGNMTANETFYLTVIAVDQDTGLTSRSETVSASAADAAFNMTADTTDLTVTVGETSTLTLVLTTTLDPYPTAVGLYSDDLDDGIHVKFQVAGPIVTPTVGGAEVLVDISASSGMYGGVYTVPLQALGEGGQEEVIVLLTVDEPMVEVAVSPDEITLDAAALLTGETVAVTLDATALHDADWPVELDLDDAPSGLLYSFSQDTMSPGDSASLTFTDTIYLSNGVYTMAIRSEAGLQKQTIPVTLTVEKPDFSLTPVLNNMQMMVGETAVFAIQVSVENMSGPVSFGLGAASSPIPGGTVGFAAAPTNQPQDPLALTAPDVVYLIVKTDAETMPAQQYHVQAEVQGGGRTRTESFYVTTLTEEEATKADLSVSKSTTEETAVIGGLVTYTLRVVNYGAIKAENVVLTDTLPAQTELLSVTPGRGICEDDGSTILCDLYDLRRGVSVDVTVVVSISTVLTPLVTLENRAEVASDQPDDAQSDNTSILELVTEAQSDLTVSIAGTPDPVATDNVLTYTIQIGNDGPTGSDAVALNLDLPDDVSLLSVTPEQGACSTSLDQATVTCDVGAIGNGLSLAVTAVVSVNVGASGLLECDATVSADETDPDAGDNAETELTIVDDNADLSVGKTASPDPVVAGERLTYTIVVTNYGPSYATGVVVSDVLPSGVTYAWDDGGGYYDKSSGEWNIGEMGKGISDTLHILVTVNKEAVNQTVNNIAAIKSSEQPDPQAGNDRSNASVEPLGADLRVIKRVDNNRPHEGDTHVYTLTVINNGPADATNIVVSDTLPISVTYVLDDDGGGIYKSKDGTWSIAGLDEGVSATLHITFTVNAGTAGQTITNTAVVAAVDQGDPDLNNNENDAVLIVKSVELEVDKVVNDGTPRAGDTITYTIEVVNNRSYMIPQVIISDVLPNGVTYGSWDATRGDYDPITGEWGVGDLAVRESETLYITAEVVVTDTAGQTITNTAIIDTSNWHDPVPENSQNDAAIAVQEVDALIVTVTPSGYYLVYTDTHGLTTTLEIPPGAVPHTATLIYTPRSELAHSAAPRRFANYAFDLDIYQGAVLQAGYSFAGPITITIHYSDTVVGGAENVMLLNYWNGTTWEDACCYCTGEYSQYWDGTKWVDVFCGEYDRHPDENWLAIPICHLSPFALLGPAPIGGVTIPLSLPTWLQSWLLLAALIATGAIAAVLLKRRKV